VTDGEEMDSQVMLDRLKKFVLSIEKL
jgi:hypothetical protein